MHIKILVNKTSAVSQSPFKFKAAPINDQLPEVKMNELENINDGRKVLLKGTVMSIAPIRAVSTGKVQDTIICDSSGSVNLSVWEDNVDQLEVGKSYCFHNVAVRSYRGEKSVIFLPKNI